MVDLWSLAKEVLAHNKLRITIPKSFFMNFDPTKPLIRCLGDGASENNNTVPEQEKNKSIFKKRKRKEQEL